MPVLFALMCDETDVSPCELNTGCNFACWQCRFESSKRKNKPFVQFGHPRFIRSEQTFLLFGLRSDELISLETPGGPKEVVVEKMTKWLL